MALKRIVSFGARHQEGTPAAGPGVLVLDIRQKFRNPYHNKKLRKFRGTDADVQADIRKTPDFYLKYAQLRAKIMETPDLDVVYIGCTGGHHRSVYLAELLAKDLHVEVVHRDIDKP
jgi:UPF0042 nucleotide-binding protein